MLTGVLPGDPWCRWRLPIHPTPGDQDRADQESSGGGQGWVTCTECASAPSLIVDEKNATTSLLPVASRPM